VIVITATIFIILFSINIAFSFERLKDNKSAWGFENGEVQLNRREGVIISLTHEQLIGILHQEKAIKEVVSFGYTSLSLLSHANLPEQEIFGKVYDNISSSGLLNLQGVHPRTAGEISLCIGTARQSGKHPGDSIHVFIEGQKAGFVVTGIYQDISNMGQGFRLSAEAMKKLNPIYHLSIYSITLKDKVDVNACKNYLLKKLGETISIDASIEDRIAQMGIVSGMEAALFALSLFFILIMLLTISNDILTSIAESRKHFGILKAYGWTPGQIRLSMVWKIIFIILAALVIAIPAAIWLSPVIMGQVTGSFGLIKFPFLLNYPGMLFILPLAVFIIIICAWWLSAGAAAATPRALINS
jgi:putative ABC transport system permease protein